MPRPPKVKGLAKARTDCPFSGNPLVFAEVKTLAAGHEVVKIQVRGTGWVSSQLFNSRAEAEWLFSHDAGTEPAFPNPFKRVQIVGERKPPDPAELAAKSLERHHAKLGEDAAEALK